MWVGIGQAVRMLTTFATVFILARLLTPTEFGVIAIIIAIALAANVLGSFGLGPVAVQKEEINDTELSTIFWFNLVASAALTLLIVVSAEWIAVFLEAPQLTLPLQVSAIIFPATTVRVAHRAILERALSFKKIALAEVIGTIAGAIVAVGLALWGAGIWALVGQQITLAVTASASYFLMSRWLPRWQFSLEKCVEFLVTGWKLTVSEILVLFSTNINRPIISIALGIEALGFYNFAQQLISYPYRNVAAVLQSLLFPVLSRVQNEEEKFTHIHLSFLHILALVMTPIVVVIFAMGDKIVLVFFGEKWLPIVGFLYLIGFAALIGAFRQALKSVLLAKAKANVLMGIETASTVLNISALLIGVNYGLKGVALCSLIAASMTLTLTIIFFVNYLNYQYQAFFKVLFPVFLSNSLTALVLLADPAKYVTGNPLANIVLSVLLAGAVYVLGELLFDRKRFLFLLHTLQEALLKRPKPTIESAQ